jgi:hypothetical protein
MKFKATVREQKSPIGRYGRIVSKSLTEFIGKEVEITVKAASD